MKETHKIFRRSMVKMLSMAVAAAFLTGFTATSLTVQAAEMETETYFSVKPQAENATTLEVEELKAEVLTEAELLPHGNANARTMMVDCIISICSSEEGMHIEISTGTVGTASYLGVKDVEIKKKVWYGWKTVATCSGAESQNHSMMGISVMYANAEKDATYRVTCVHYADVDGYIEAENDTGAFVFTY